MKDNMFKKIAFNAVVLTAFAAVSAFSASVAKADETNYVTLELDFGAGVAAEDVAAAKAKYENTKYET